MENHVTLKKLKISKEDSLLISRNSDSKVITMLPQYYLIYKMKIKMIMLFPFDFKNSGVNVKNDKERIKDLVV